MKTKTLGLGLGLLLAGGASGCGNAGGVQGDDANVKRDTSFEIEVIGEGLWERHARGFNPAILHTWTVGDDGQPEHITDTAISFDASTGKNRRVAVRIANARAHRPFGFVIMHRDDHYKEVWGEDHFIDPKRPEGTWLRIPVASSASYPYSPECYRTRVHSPAWSTDGISDYRGKIKELHVAFTTATPEEFYEKKNAPWEDGYGRPLEDGAFFPSYGADNSNKPTLSFAGDWVRIPADRNLVIEVRSETASGQCGLDGDTGPIQNEKRQFLLPVRDAASN